MLSSKDDECFICGRPATDTHHIFHGCRRKAADEMGLTVRLCRYCHSMIHDKGKYDRELQQLCQEEWERTHSREEWMEKIGKNYLT